MKIFWTGLVLLVLSSLLVGCGIAQEKYDSVVGEREAAKTQVTSVQGDLEKAKAQVTSVQGDLEKAKTQVTSVQGDLDKAKTQTASVQADLDKARTQIKSLQDEVSAAKTKYSDLASQNATAAKQIEALKRLTILKTVFCSARPYADNYTAQRDNTYRVGDAVWVYAELIGYKVVVGDNKLQRDFETEFRVLNEKGDVVNRWVTTAQREIDRPFALVWYSYNPSALKAGNYILEVNITDKLAGETANWKGNFKVTA